MDNDQLELSSGEIALYVMDSLQVEEHFTVGEYRVEITE